MVWKTTIGIRTLGKILRFDRQFILEIAGEDIDDDDDDRIGNKQRLKKIVCPEFSADVHDDIDQEINV